MTSNVRMILNEVNARIKLAEAKTAEDPSNFDSFPGAENDKAVAEEMKNPDPEVKDEGPASRTETTGAEPGSDVPLQQDHLYEADEPVLTPEKKPAESADANAKEASADVQKVAADILSVIKSSLAKKPEEKKAEENKPAEKEAAEKCAKCGKVAAECKCGADKKEEKKASDMISLGSRILDKIASVREAKKAGAADALNLIKAASEYNRGARDAEMLIQKLAQALEESANSADAAEEGTPEAAGAADAEAAIADAAAADAGADAPEGNDEVTPEEVLQAVNDLVEEGQISDEEAATLVEQLGGGEEAPEGGDVSEDQLAEGIAQAIENGEITEDEAQQLVQELVAAGADESLASEAAEAAPAEAAPAAAEAADAAAAADEAAGAADAEAAIADAQKTASAIQKQAEDAQIARYQKGFIQKCAEYGADPKKVAQYIQARISGQL